MFLPAHGDWGEDISLQEGEIVNKNYTLPTSSEWKEDDLSVVAFIYNEQGVQQVTKVNINNHINM